MPFGHDKALSQKFPNKKLVNSQIGQENLDKYWNSNKRGYTKKHDYIVILVLHKDVIYKRHKIFKKKDSMEYCGKICKIQNPQRS